MKAGPELVFGLVGAAGTDLRKVGDMLAAALGGVGYASHYIHLSSLLDPERKWSSQPEDERIDTLMTIGDEFRITAERGDAVALLGLLKIQRRRRELSQDDQADRPLSPARTAHIIHSLKHPDELKTLRAIYGAAFVAVAVYMPKSMRIDALAKRIQRSRRAYRAKKYRAKAETLIERDEEEVGIELGQNVRNVFPECDVFLDATEPAPLGHQITRFVEILFRHPQRTPTREEYALFHAKAAALRSADLSRQVGAVITNAGGDILTAGCNEVPKVDGGVVWEGDDAGGTLDRRDFRLGYDSSVMMKHELLSEVLSKLKDAGWLDKPLLSEEIELLVDRALYGDKPLLKGTRAASIIEFGRIVHAEMASITAAARLGISVRGGTLYCTTFPCHMCARHIVAAGIKDVVYVEPYPKSMARELYEGAIRVDHDPEAMDTTVHFRPFVGVAPRRFIEFFEMPRRKTDRGHIIEWDALNALPRVQQFDTYRDIEVEHIALLQSKSQAMRMILSPSDQAGVEYGGPELANGGDESRGFGGEQVGSSKAGGNEARGYRNRKTLSRKGRKTR